MGSGNEMGLNSLADRGFEIWWVVGGWRAGVKRTNMKPKSRGPDLCQRWELGQTEGMYGGLLRQTDLLGTFFTAIYSEVISRTWWGFESKHTVGWK